MIAHFFLFGVVFVLAPNKSDFSRRSEKVRESYRTENDAFFNE